MQQRVADLTSSEGVFSTCGYMEDKAAVPSVGHSLIRPLPTVTPSCNSLSQGLLDFCNQPGFVRAVFLNLDCRIERANLFETAAGLLSKTAFPVNRPLAAVHLLALDGLLAIMSSLARGCGKF